MNTPKNYPPRYGQPPPIIFRTFSIYVHDPGIEEDMMRNCAFCARSEAEVRGKIMMADAKVAICLDCAEFAVRRLAQAREFYVKAPLMTQKSAMGD